MLHFSKADTTVFTDEVPKLQRDLMICNGPACACFHPARERLTVYHTVMAFDQTHGPCELDAAFGRKKRAV